MLCCSARRPFPRVFLTTRSTQTGHPLQHKHILTHAARQRPVQMTHNRCRDIAGAHTAPIPLAETEPLFLQAKPSPTQAAVRDSVHHSVLRQGPDPRGIWVALNKRNPLGRGSVWDSSLMLPWHQKANEQLELPKKLPGTTQRKGNSLCATEKQS